MNSRERGIVSAILLLVAVLVAFDVLSDLGEGVDFWHVFMEGLIGLVALAGVFYLLRGSFEIRHQLQSEVARFSAYQKEAESWRAQSKKYIEGLASAIDQQLSQWQLSVAEKEVAFLLLKGLSLKEIAEIRKTSEKTARVQSMAIYAKAGVSGRSELSAFFLEDLLLPGQNESST